MTMTAQDMRTEALGVERTGLGRDVRLAGGLLGVLFLGFGGWAASVPLDAAAVASGVVVVSGRSETIAASQGGRVTGVFVDEGDIVKAGDLLLTLDSSLPAGDVQAMRALRVDLLAQRALLLSEAGRANEAGRPAAGLSESEWARVTRRQSELAARRSTLGATLAMHAQRSAQVRAQIAGLSEQRQSVERQIELARDEAATLADLSARGLATTSRLRQAERLVAQLEERLSGIDSQTAALEERASEIRLEQARVSSDHTIRTQDDLAAVDARLAELAPRLAAAETALSQLEFRATTDGQVMNLAARNIGDVITAGQPVLDIVPSSRRLAVEVRIDPRDADDLFPGMAADLRLTGLAGDARQSHGGVLTRISPDRITDAHTREAWFTAHVESDYLDAAAAMSGAVRPGLPVDVMIPLRKRTLLQYLTEPLDQALWRTMRES